MSLARKRTSSLPKLIDETDSESFSGLITTLMGACWAAHEAEMPRVDAGVELALMATLPETCPSAVCAVLDRPAPSGDATGETDQDLSALAGLLSFMGAIEILV